jgi:DNA-binding beta-propeller fold protein YncE
MKRAYGSWKRTAGSASLATLLVICCLFGIAAQAFAAPSFLWRAPEGGLTGSGAGDLNNPRTLAVDPATGHIYVAENQNRRVSEFTAWGEFVKAWGWGVATGAAELESCGPGAIPPTEGCQTGIPGDGSGQFGALSGGVVVDGAGEIYVVDPENHRVQKFDSDGNFLLMFGGNVNETKVEGGGTEAEKNLCTAASGNECGPGVTGVGEGKFSEWPAGDFIDVGSDDTLYVGDKDRIQEFNPNGTFKGQIALPEPGLVHSIAVDPPSGALYMAYNQDFNKEVPEKPFIYRHTSSGWEEFTESGRPASG